MLVVLPGPTNKCRTATRPTKLVQKTNSVPSRKDARDFLELPERHAAQRTASADTSVARCPAKREEDGEDHDFSRVNEDRTPRRMNAVGD